MINLRVRTENSFGFAYGPLPKVIAAVGEAPALAITDRSGTWGHVAFEKACRKAGKKPIFGVELAVVEKLEQQRHPANWMTFLARNDAGLREIYELTTESTSVENFYYHPRIDYKRLSGISQQCIILGGHHPRLDLLPRQNNLWLEASPPSDFVRVTEYAKIHRIPVVATSDNYYPQPGDRPIYEIIAGRNRDSKTTPMHILDTWQHALLYPGKFGDAARAATYRIAEECNATIPKARMVKVDSPQTLEQMCRRAAPARRVNLADPIYAARLKRELDLINEKDFADYFYVIADLLKYAKQHMLVGPARGSSCGSLVCYLLSITEIDPIPFKLLFERFIDVNRKDLPDIDIDFPDDRRDMVFEYIGKKYGAECVARLGTVMRYQAKSAIDAVAIALKVPIVETNNLKNSIMERSGGDARAAFCILDTFNELEIGRAMLKQYPHLRVAADIENHAKCTGQHAAGVVITAEPIARFCSMNLRNGVAMVDKYDAESVNLLKIDALGLRTLSVIQDCLDQVNQTREWLLNYPLDDVEAFEIINESKFAGIFQFEGYALQSLCQQMRVENFEDIAALGALARPGPLNSGGANEWIKRRIGATPVVYLHPSLEEITKVSYGVVIYQETVMQIARHMGKLSWEDVSELRKAMSKSLGDEFFGAYKVRFLAGAESQGVTLEDANNTWKNICTMGSWSFNRCLAGDTKIRCRAGRWIKAEETIEDLYNKYVANPNSQNKFGGPVVTSLYPDGRVWPQRVRMIHQNGIKPILHLEFSDGSRVKCTREHKFIITGKWLEVGSAVIGDKFTSSCKDSYPHTYYLPVGKGGRIKGKKTGQGSFQSGAKHPAYHNGRNLAERQFKLRMEGKPCQGCRTISKKREVHHQDDCHGYERPKDMKWLCVSCHRKQHYANKEWKLPWQKGYVTCEVVLTGIYNGKEEMTYDLEMPIPHNFALANGLITHNSHAIAYGMVSYWCLVLKAKYPLEWAVACLRSTSDEAHCIKLLRELDREGYKYRDFDIEHSELNWSVKNNIIIGGLTNLVGIGASKAKGILASRKSGKPMTPSIAKKLLDGITPFSHTKVFECSNRFRAVITDPSAYGIESKIWDLADITSGMSGDFLFWGKLIKKDLRDLNEPFFVQKRGGVELGPGEDRLFLNMTVEDDTANILVAISKRDYERIGTYIYQNVQLGDWLLWKGRMRAGFRKIYIDRYLTEAQIWARWKPVV